jgi:hypothetical protein
LSALGVQLLLLLLHLLHEGDTQNAHIRVVGALGWGVCVCVGGGAV